VALLSLGATSLTPSFFKLTECITVPDESLLSANDGLPPPVATRPERNNIA